MKVKVSKWGNSLGLRLPLEVVKNSIGAGTILDVEIKDGIITATPVKSENSKLENLLSGITPQNYGGELDFGKPVGKEVW